ncbi:MAG: hypothetical protein LBC18_11245, partial [Opitutaceae bacterium]|nr:hypothetical protein [Opitutaceae bacterium]
MLSSPVILVATNPAGNKARRRRETQKNSAAIPPAAPVFPFSASHSQPPSSSLRGAIQSGAAPPAAAGFNRSRSSFSSFFRLSSFVRHEQGERERERRKRKNKEERE